MQPMLNIALRAARKAGTFIERAFDDVAHLPIETKGQNDFVTKVDRKAEAIIIETILKSYPNHIILGEESGEIAPDSASHSKEEQEPYQWIIDPLDGTTNFIYGMPHFAISIACIHKGTVQHAVVYDPIKKEEFTASRGRGAQLNGKRIRVSNRHQMRQALIGTGFPYKTEQNEHLDDYLGMLKEISEQTVGVRRPGAASLDLAYVASGRFDGFWEFGLQPWDIAAGELLIQEAGGLSSDFTGGNNKQKSGNIVAGNPKIFKAILKSIQPYLKGKLKA